MSGRIVTTGMPDAAPACSMIVLQSPLTYLLTGPA
jgi:hypothetical protein